MKTVRQNVWVGVTAFVAAWGLMAIVGADKGQEGGTPVAQTSQQWEYKFVSRLPGQSFLVYANTLVAAEFADSYAGLLLPVLNELGAKGWEVCCATDYGYLCKRPVNPAPGQ